jgi:ABC-type lipoprotein export system ATPase subunit
MRLFQQLNEEQRITIVIVTHDAHVASYANRTIHIRDGLIEDEQGVATPMSGAKAEAT